MTDFYPRRHDGPNTFAAWTLFLMALSMPLVSIVFGPPYPYAWATQFALDFWERHLRPLPLTEAAALSQQAVLRRWRWLVAAILGAFAALEATRGVPWHAIILGVLAVGNAILAARLKVEVTPLPSAT